MSSPAPAAATLPVGLRVRLSACSFLQYFIWGAWFVTLGTYLGQGLACNGRQIGLAAGSLAIGALLSPALAGALADRCFAAERLLAVLHAAAGLVLLAAAAVREFTLLYPLLVLYAICYMPTVTLGQALIMRHIPDSRRFYPGIRVWGTIGWIAAGLLVGGLGIEAGPWPMRLAAAASLAQALYSLTLPHTPPAGNPSRRLSLLPWREALPLLRDRDFRIFAATVFLLLTLSHFYHSFGNLYFNDIGFAHAAGKMTLGQVTEIGLMLAVPAIMARLGMKRMLLIGLLCWAARYALLAFGNAGERVWMLYLGIALHGVCYGFFTVVAYIYADRRSPPGLRASVQGFMAFLSSGLGWFVGSLLSGSLAQTFSQPGTAGGQVYQWLWIWLLPAFGALAIAVFFALLFRGAEAVPAEQAQK